MAVTSPSTPLGTPLPDVALPDLDGTPVRLLEGGGPVLLVFACNHCPYVKHVESALGALMAQFPQVRTYAVASNDVEQYPQDDVPHLREQVARAGWTFGYVVDADQSFAGTLGAVCTPDFFLFDDALRLAYRGALDASTPGNGQPLTGADLRAALESVLAGAPAPSPQRPAMGCSIKWKGE
jgi:thiol-disulfide isomerase/thioredoxin